MHGLIAANFLALLIYHAQEEGLEPHVERWSDGSVRIEVERFRAESGEVRWHGSYEEFAEDGTKTVRGEYDEGERSGRWVFYHPSGEKKETGRFKKGVRSGKWQGYLPDGSADPELTGRCKATTFEHKLGTGSGALLNEVPHGIWEWSWPAGGVMLRGTYRLGEWEGQLRFFHPNGSLDPALFTGVYERGERKDYLAREEVPHAPVMLDGLGSPGPLKVSPTIVAEQETVARWLKQFVASPKQAPALGRRVVTKHGQAALAPAVDGLLRQDIHTREGRANARAIAEHVLLPLIPGCGLSLPGLDVEDEWSWNLSRLRFYTIAHMNLCAPMLAAIEYVSGSTDASPLWPSYVLKKRKKVRLESNATKLLQKSAAFIAAHQATKGYFPSRDCFKVCGEERCGILQKVKAGKISLGDATAIQGSTALAILALLGLPEDLREPYLPAVVRGVVYFLSIQSEDGGCGGWASQSSMYEHAAATQALCAAREVFGSTPRLDQAIRRAVGFILRGQNTGAGWRYASPPNGQSSTSVTGWMLDSLRDAQEQGFAVPHDAFEGGLAFIRSMTDPTTFRCGYRSRGGPSRRVLGINERWSYDATENLTAVAVICRMRTGDLDQEALEGGLGRVAKRPPELGEHQPGVEEGPTTDLHYLMFGARSIAFGEPKERRTWRKKALSVAQELVETEGHAEGAITSRVDPFGHRGGIIVMTAQCMLALEAPLWVELRKSD